MVFEFAKNVILIVQKKMCSEAIGKLGNLKM